MRKSISLSESTVKQLKAVKNGFNGLSHTEYSWDSFMTQIILLGECLLSDHDVGEVGTKPVKLERIGAWFGRALCPYCAQQNSPLKIKDGLVWGVTCSKCGKRFIVVI